MDLIAWSDDIKLGVPSIDAEHRRLMDLTNNFLAAAEDEALMPQLAAILEELIEHTRAHFQTEERLLDQCSYPQLMAHKTEHTRLLNETQRLHDRFCQPEASTSLALEAAQYLQHWLLDHIVASDKPFRPYLMRLG
ncbi:MAG: bacteriohemerythrin [Phaeospirillum sp.]|nr:bacteriohemerythrin [Phaeospirillum sp.]